MGFIKRLATYLFPGTLIRFFKSNSYNKLFFLGEYEKSVQRIKRGVFVRENLKNVREGIRREFDKVNEDLDAVNIALEKSTDEIREQLTKAKEGKEKDIEQLKKQIDAIDKQISEPGGIEEQIASQRTILPLIERFIKKGE